ncbi:hypothetical protein VTH82DRAFT_2795 [Thermothelomyces myriococcoides]
MEPVGPANVPVETHLLLSCYREADQADIVAMGLDQLRAALSESFHGYLIALAGEIRDSSRLLRSLVDCAHVYITRVPFMTNYLSILLPCLSRTLKDIVMYYEEKTLSREIRWRKMYNKMTEEAGGLPLPQRFVLFNHFLSLLKQLLTRSPNFDLNTLEMLRARVAALREQLGISPPPQAGTLVRQNPMPLVAVQDRNSHWAEQIFSLPLPSRTALKHLRPSKSYGPFYPWGHLAIPHDSTVLFKRPFENDTISVVAFLSSVDQCPYFLVRTLQNGAPWYSMFGAHELCIEREGKMVLFYCTFVALKARSLLTVQIHPDEFRLRREKRLFQAQIIDDGFRHSLIVYEDQQTGGLRLHAAVWEGELRECPVWTAFVTHQSQSPTWLSRRSRNRVWLKDIQLYVFCSTYRQENMRQNKLGAFEIHFDRVEAARRFKELFSIRSAASEASETEQATGSAA